jgi:hypothetical protein
VVSRRTSAALEDHEEKSSPELSWGRPSSIDSLEQWYEQTAEHSEQSDQPPEDSAQDEAASAQDKAPVNDSLDYAEFARQFKEDNPIIASNSSANAMLSERWRVARAKHAGTLVTLEDLAQDQPDSAQDPIH